MLADVWKNLLNLERVGINDNFFELGGDSILSIQIIARAAQAGLRLTPKQLFQHQTIAELAGVLGDQATYSLADDDYARYPERISAVDLDTANSVAVDYLVPETAAIIVVGDLETIEASIRELNLGPIRYCDREGNLMDTSTDYSSR